MFPSLAIVKERLNDDLMAMDGSYLPMEAVAGLLSSERGNTYNGPIIDLDPP